MKTNFNDFECGVKGLWDGFAATNPDRATGTLLQMTADAAVNIYRREVDVIDVLTVLAKFSEVEGGWHE